MKVNFSNFTAQHFLTYVLWYIFYPKRLKRFRKILRKQKGNAISVAFSTAKRNQQNPYIQVTSNGRMFIDTEDLLRSKKIQTTLKKLRSSSLLRGDVKW